MEISHEHLEQEVASSFSLCAQKPAGEMIDSGEVLFIGVRKFTYGLEAIIGL